MTNDLVRPVVAPSRSVDSSWRAMAARITKRFTIVAMLLATTPYAVVGWRYTGCWDSNLVDVEFHSLQGGAPGSVSGTVVDGANGPVPGARVRFVNFDSGAVSFIADENGRYSGTISAAVVHRVEVSCDRIEAGGAVRWGRGLRLLSHSSMQTVNGGIVVDVAIK